MAGNLAHAHRVGSYGCSHRFLVLDVFQHRHVLRLGKMNEQDRKRKRALIAFQIFAYGWLLAMFLIQLYMSFDRGWWDL